MTRWWRRCYDRTCFFPFSTRAARTSSGGKLRGCRAGTADSSLWLLVRLSAQQPLNTRPRCSLCTAGCLAWDLDFTLCLDVRLRCKKKKLLTGLAFCSSGSDDDVGRKHFHKAPFLLTCLAQAAIEKATTVKSADTGVEVIPAHSLDAAIVQAPPPSLSCNAPTEDNCQH